ncbi:MAG TPA: hypothetical protein VKZ51_08970 [Cyclobacteriaceae bacterium]|nr:hypothetical protein [Cyclobacteriaceae bacterium]
MVRVKNHYRLKVLTVVLTLLSAIASGLGLLMPELYRDNDFVKTAWYGNDWVTLAIVVPALIIVLVFSREEAFKIRIIWMGLISYLFYNYSFYLFGAAFNSAFLIYTAIFSLSLFILMMGLSSMQVQGIVGSSKLLRGISIYLFFIAFMLCMVEVSQSILFITEGRIPEIMIKTQHPGNIVFALDLGLIVPAMFLSAVWLWQKKFWGYVLGAMMLIKGFTYGLVLFMGGLLMESRNLGEDPMLPVWLLLSLSGLGCLVILFNKTKLQPAILSR